MRHGRSGHHAARAQPDDPAVLHHHGAIGLIARGECLVTHRRGLGGEVTLISGRAQRPPSAGKIAGANPAAGIADSFDLSMGGGVMIGVDPVPAFADDRATTHNNRARARAMKEAGPRCRGRIMGWAISSQPDGQRA